MWKITQIKATDLAVIYKDFDVICSIAKTMKGCHNFFLSQEDRRLYGANETPYSLHTIDLPQWIEVVNSLLFRYSTIDLGIVSKYRDFIIYPNNPWMMLPFETMKDHPSYKSKYTGPNSGWKMVDADNNLVDFIDISGIDTPVAMTLPSLSLMINKQREISSRLGPAKIFGNMETNPVIREVMDNKVTLGSKYLRLTDMNGKNYGIMIFRNLFTLNKNDTLTISIRDVIGEDNLFQVIFTTTRKKSPIPNIIPQFQETVYAMCFNI